MRKVILLTLFWLQLMLSCRKEGTVTDCENLKEGISTSSVEKVRLAVNNLISQIPNKDYKSENLSALVQRISSTCDVTCEVLCFDCIQTFPSQSEIKVTFSSADSIIQKVIDISYTTANMMTFRNMHE